MQQETGAVSERSPALNSPLTTSVSACALSLSLIADHPSMII